MKVRRHKIKGFTIVSNKMLQDKNLSHKAKGLMAQMYSYPDDWVFSIAGLVKQSKEGEKGIKAALIELEEAGYLKRTPVRDERGLFTEMEYDLYPEPIVDKPPAENPSAEKRLADLEGQNNNKTTKEEITNKENTPLSGSMKESRQIEPVKEPRIPTLDMVKAYWEEKHLNGKAEEFFSYYESNGWRVGKNPMKKWRAAASGWSSREVTRHSNRYGRDNSNPYSMDEYNELPF